jgi:hypothetical protein
MLWRFALAFAAMGAAAAAAIARPLDGARRRSVRR